MNLLIDFVQLFAFVIAAQMDNGIFHVSLMVDLRLIDFGGASNSY